MECHILTSHKDPKGQVNNRECSEILISTPPALLFHLGLPCQKKASIGDPSAAPSYNAYILRKVRENVPYSGLWLRYRIIHKYRRYAPPYLHRGLQYKRPLVSQVALLDPMGGGSSRHQGLEES